MSDADRRRLDLLERALRVSDRERWEIASQGHDVVVQDLAATRYAMASVQRDVPEHRRRVAEAILETLERSVDRLRELQARTSLPDLFTVGLGPALDTLARAVLPGVAVTVQVEDLPRLPGVVGTALHRAARGALIHVARHENVGVVSISVSRTEEGVELVIYDDGSGAWTGGLPLPPDAGLVEDLVGHSVEELGGSVETTTAPYGGTRLRVHVPGA